jgi:hypothetical protein
MFIVDGLWFIVGGCVKIQVMQKLRMSLFLRISNAEVLELQRLQRCANCKFATHLRHITNVGEQEVSEGRRGSKLTTHA